MPPGVLSHPSGATVQTALSGRPEKRLHDWSARLAVSALVGLLHLLFFAFLLWSVRPGFLPASTVTTLEVGWLAAPGDQKNSPSPAPPAKAETRPATREKSPRPEPLPAAGRLLSTENGPTSSQAARASEGETLSAAPTNASAGNPNSGGGAPSAGGNNGNVEAPGFDAAYLSNPAPPYPGLSRELGEEGRVQLRVLVSAEGKAQEIEVNKSSGHERLDRAASRAVWNWRFVPGRRDGQPLAAWVIVPINFSLRK